MEFYFLMVSGGALAMLSAILAIIIRPEEHAHRMAHTELRWRALFLGLAIAVVKWVPAVTESVPENILNLLLMGAMFLLVPLLFRLTAPVLTALTGAASNCLVVLANGYRMPVVAQGVSSVTHITVGPDVRFWYLADIFPMYEGSEMVSAYSIGDIAYCVGFWWFFARTLTMLLERE